MYKSFELQEYVDDDRRDVIAVTEGLPEGEIDLFLRRRVCARCYGDLEKQFGPGRNYITRCAECGYAWNGATVSRSYAERLGQQALGELAEVKHNLPDLFPNPNRGKSESQLLAEMGF